MLLMIDRSNVLVIAAIIIVGYHLVRPILPRSFPAAFDFIITLV